MSSPQDFLTEFAKAIVHNIDTRPQIVQQWAEKLEAREGELGRQFYDRFEKEMQQAQYCIRPPEEIPPTFLVVTASVLEAARKAAGIQ